jgi:uncharacterized protein YktB (UPF0637 family)
MHTQPSTAVVFNNHSFIFFFFLDHKKMRTKSTSNLINQKLIIQKNEQSSFGISSGDNTMIVEGH